LTTKNAKDNATVLRRHAEHEFAEELQALAQADQRPKPPNWKLSPWAVSTYLLGGTLDNGVRITPKYIGDKRLMEIAVASLTTDRALLLLGVPGTAKSWVSEHLAAAISGDSGGRGHALRLELCLPARQGAEF
jgi:predicted NACHT family NTPase